MINLELDDIKDWKKEISETEEWLTNLQNAIKNPEFKKLHGNIERIDRLKKKLTAILEWLNGFKKN